MSGKINEKIINNDKLLTIVVEFLNEKGCEVRGEIVETEILIAGKGPLKIEKDVLVKSIDIIGDVISNYSIGAKNHIKLTGSLVARGSIAAGIIDVGGNIESKEGSISGDKIKAGGYIKSYAWTRAEESIEAGLFIEVTGEPDFYWGNIRAPKISAGLNAKGMLENQVIKGGLVRCDNVVSGTVVNTTEYKDYYG